MADQGFYDYSYAADPYYQQGSYIGDVADSSGNSEGESVRIWAGICIFLVICLMFGVIIVLLIVLQPDATAPIKPPPLLLCSVGSPAAAIQPLHPPDKTCDIIFLTHVRIRNGKLQPVLNTISFPTFRNACAAYQDTTCGLSFHSYFLHHEDFYPTELVEHLKELMTTAHINHYGILNVYGAPAYVTNVSTTMEFTETLKEFRTLLGDDREKHKVVVGVGYYFYNDSNSWDNLARTVDSIVAYDEVDVVTIITTPLEQPDRRQCITLPVNALDSQNEFVPKMEAAYRFAKAGFGKPSVLVAFALQMGVVYYTLHQEYDLPISALYQGCNGFGVTDYSQACQADTTELTFERTVIGLIPPEVVQMFGDRRLFLSHDTLDLMEMKASRIMSRSDIRDKFTWFLFNVHLTDHTKSCLPGGPFERLKGFRHYLDRRASMPKG
ncbi:hypothetical protein MRX96_026800 [Rhipicephalus microplus]